MAIAQSSEQFGWLLGWQQRTFQDSLPGAQKPHFDDFKLIWGEYDPYITVAVAVRRQSQLKNATLTVVPAGHRL
jgi:haloalkane dehalogenase